MGNQQSLNPNIPPFVDSDWQEITSRQSEHPQYGWFRTLTHIENGTFIDEYEVIYSDEHDYQYYLDIFVGRLNQPDFVQTLYIKENHKQEICSKTYLAKVYIQHIETRLSDITDIPYPQNLYVGLAALEGFHKLYNNFHYFRVEENQICVDNEGHVRVWLNADLSKNLPNFDDCTLGGDETFMVQQIITILTQNTDFQSQPQSLREYFLQYGDKVTFDKAKIIISQYARKHNAKIPQYFQSILEIYQKHEESQSQSEQLEASEEYNDKGIQKNYHPSSPQLVTGNITKPINEDPHFNKHPYLYNNHHEHPNFKSIQNRNHYSHQNLIPINDRSYKILSPPFQPFGNPLGFQPRYTQTPSQLIYYRKPQFMSFRSPQNNQQVILLNSQVQKPQSQIGPQSSSKKYSPEKQSPGKSPTSVLKKESPNINVIPPNQSQSKANNSKQQIVEVELPLQTQNSKMSNSQKNKSQAKSNRKNDQQIRNNFKVEQINMISNQNNQTASLAQVVISNSSSSKQQIGKQTKKIGQVDRQKTVYYTADTEEQLDPEIAADLKKMHSQL